MRKALTNEEFLKRLQKVHPGYTALEKYQKANIKIAIRCDKGHVFKIQPTNLINQGLGCAKCSYIAMSKKQRRTNKEFLELLKKVHPDYTALEKYKGATTQIAIKCPKGHTFKITPSSLLKSGQKCTICRNIELHKANQLTNDKFSKRLQAKCPGYKALDKYVDCKTEIRFKCPKGHVFKTMPTYLFKRKIGCPECAAKNRHTTRLSNEEFLRRLQKAHPGYAALEEYKTSHTKIAFKCDKGHVFKAKPADIIGQRGTGCRICAVNRQRTTQEEFLKRLQKVHPGYMALEEYKSIHTKIKFKCNKGHIFEAEPNSIINRGECCRICAFEKLRQSQIMPKDQFIQKLQQSNPTIKLISPYTKSSDRMQFKCIKCGHIWKTGGTHLIGNNPNGCPNCAKVRMLPTLKLGPESIKISKEEFAQRVHQAYPKWHLLSEYQSQGNQVIIKCEHDHIFKAWPQQLWRKHVKCNDCDYLARKNNALKQLAKRHPGYKMLSKFINTSHKAEFMCNKGHKFIANTDSVLRATGCPECNIKSYGEEDIKKYFKKHDIKYLSPFKPATCLDKGRLHYDFKVGNILIEYQGQQHYRPVDYFGGIKQFELQQRHDQIKREWAKNNGYREIEIKYNQDVHEVLDKIFSLN